MLQLPGCVVQQTAGDCWDGIVVVVGIFGFLEKYKQNLHHLMQLCATVSPRHLQEL